jgi:hypothetical protein
MLALQRQSTITIPITITTIPITIATIAADAWIAHRQATFSGFVTVQTKQDNGAYHCHYCSSDIDDGESVLPTS